MAEHRALEPKGVRAPIGGYLAERLLSTVDRGSHDV
jgi:hypothetical protein